MLEGILSFVIVVGMLIWRLVEPRMRWYSAQKATIERSRRVNQEVRVLTPEMIPADVNRESLATVTKLMEDLGFVFLADTATRVVYGDGGSVGGNASPIAGPGRVKVPMPPSPVEAATFTRRFAHPVHGCLGNLNSSMVTTMTTGKRRKWATISVTSYAGTDENSWAYTTTTGAASPSLKLLRRPRHLSNYLPQATMPAEILRIHLERRAAIAAAGGFSWDRAPTLQSYLRDLNNLVAHVRTIYADLTPFSLERKLKKLKRDKKKEWLGELTGRIEPMPGVSDWKAS